MLPPIEYVRNLMNLNYVCSNCGNIGHTYKMCDLPILSYGIICFNTRIKKFLFIKRRHTIAYIDFIRGKYSLSDMNFLYMLVENMTIDERNNLLEKKFKDIWDNVWLNSTANGRGTPFKNSEYKKSNEMFNLLKEGYYFNNRTYLIDNIINEINAYKKEDKTNNAWEFPKGRREQNETDLECAIREFNEETNMKCAEEIIGPITYIEEFRGSNGLSYKYVYYLYITNTTDEPYINLNNLDQVSEVGDIQWFDYNEIMEKVMCNRKKGIIRKIKDAFNIL